VSPRPHIAARWRGLHESHFRVITDVGMTKETGTVTRSLGTDSRSPDPQRRLDSHFHVLFGHRVDI
jgi:hypothetical protein